MNGGFIPYGRQIVDEDDIDAVVEVLRSDWLTTGPAVERFETAFSGFVGAEHGVAVTNGTAALHLAMLAAGIGPGDEVIVPALTFVASANAVRYVGASVVFADVREDTLTIDVDQFRQTSNSAPGRMCEPGFRYDSGTNNRFLTVEELRSLIAQELR